MNTYGLEKYGITGIKEVVYNPSYEQLFEAEILCRLSNTGNEIWANLHNNSAMLHHLIEWTEKYSKICDTVNGYGF